MENPSRDTSLEQALATTEAQADRALAATTAVVKQIRKAKAAAAAGSLRDLGRALDAARAQAAEATAEVDQLAASWRFDERAYLDSGAFARELRSAAEAQGLTMIEQDGRLLTYPSVIRVLPGDAAVEIDRKRERRLRPSRLVERLRAGQQKPPRSKAGQFIEALHDAYELLLARDGKQPGAGVRLVDVYAVLTLLPGQARDYSRQEFARDVYLLDRGDVAATRDGWKLSLPAATGTRAAGTLSTVTPDGELKVYFAMAFDR